MLRNMKSKERRPEIYAIPHGPEETRVEIAKDQDEYLTLHAMVIPNENQTTICWKFSLWARIRLLLTGKLWHTVLRSGPLQPIKITTRRTDHYLTLVEYEKVMAEKREQERADLINKKVRAAEELERRKRTEEGAV